MVKGKRFVKKVEIEGKERIKVLMEKK